jgi:hypothetical protein
MVGSLAGFLAGFMAGFMAASSTAQTWMSYFWLCVGLAATNLAFLFLIYSESNFRRPDFEYDNQFEIDPVGSKEATEKSNSFVQPFLQVTWRTRFISCHSRNDFP